MAVVARLESLNMTSMIPPLAAIAMAGVIFVRAVCVVHKASPKTHRHPLLFLGFGYSYVLLGAGALAAALHICGHDLGHLPLWLILIGSCGLIVFDRRRQQCWSITECPADREARP
ncbi:MAG: hypothetical protein RLZZ524_148 [Pseudomonadota bacterium]